MSDLLAYAWSLLWLTAEMPRVRSEFLLAVVSWLAADNDFASLSHSTAPAGLLRIDGFAEVSIAGNFTTSYGVSVCAALCFHWCLCRLCVIARASPSFHAVDASGCSFLDRFAPRLPAHTDADRGDVGRRPHFHLHRHRHAAR